MDMNDWEKQRPAAEVWMRQHFDAEHQQVFAVTVKHWQSETSKGQVENHWNIYAIICPTHPLFAQLNEAMQWNSSTRYDATCQMPLHGGCTYFRTYRSHWQDNRITAYEIGCDYGHLHDEWLEDADTQDRAWTVFNDADALFVWLMNQVQPCS